MNKPQARRALEKLLLRAMKEGLSELKRINNPPPTTKARLRQLERDLLRLKHGRDLYSHEEPRP